MATEITAYPDGPYLVRGEFDLRDPEGNPVERRRKTVAICRCGRSRSMPFCDATHKLAGFRTDEPEPVTVPVEAMVLSTEPTG